MRLDIPYYHQTLDFTCGPACLLMAMNHFAPGTGFSRAMELDLWREATLVETYGTGRYGLALAAIRRGYQVEVTENLDGVEYLAAMRAYHTDLREDLLTLLHDDVRTKALNLGVRQVSRTATLSDLKEAALAGRVSVLLTSTTYFPEDPGIPHWVVFTGFDEENAYVHDPLEGGEKYYPLPLAVMEEAIGYEGDRCVVTISGKPS